MLCSTADGLWRDLSQGVNALSIKTSLIGDFQIEVIWASTMAVPLILPLVRGESKTDVEEILSHQTR